MGTRPTPRAFIIPWMLDPRAERRRREVVQCITVQIRALQCSADNTMQPVKPRAGIMSRTSQRLGSEKGEGMSCIGRLAQYSHWSESPCLFSSPW